MFESSEKMNIEEEAKLVRLKLAELIDELVKLYGPKWPAKEFYEKQAQRLRENKMVMFSGSPSQWELFDEALTRAFGHGIHEHSPENDEKQKAIRDLIIGPEND